MGIGNKEVISLSVSTKNVLKVYIANILIFEGGN